METKDNTWKVCTLEQAKRLVELGVKLETEKHWCQHDPSNNPVIKITTEWFLSGLGRYQIMISAPDVAELGEVLPVKIISTDFNGVKWEYLLHLKKSPSGYRVKYRSWVGQSIDIFHTEIYKTEAEARCAAYIWWIEYKKEIHGKRNQIINKNQIINNSSSDRD